MDEDLADLVHNFQPNNKAVEKLISMPPALLEAIVNDPKEMGRLARAWSAHGMHHIAANFQKYTPNQQMQFLEMASKIGDLYPQKQIQTGPQGEGFAVNIYLSEQPKGARPIQVEKIVESVEEA